MCGCQCLNLQDMLEIYALSALMEACIAIKIQFCRELRVLAARHLQESPVEEPPEEAGEEEDFVWVR